LGTYEQVFLDYRRAELAGDFARALDQARELARIAPGSEATFLLGAMALRLNRPHEALRALAQVDPEKGFLRGWDGFWGYPMQAHLMLGELDQALAAAREGRRRYPDSRQAVHQEVTVLSAMGREAEVDHLLDVEDGLPESPGLPLPRTMRGAATMFRAYGFDSASRRMAERAITLLPDRDSTAAGDENRLILVEALYLLGRYAEAGPIVATMARRAPDDLTWQGYTGLLAARLGNRTEADSIMQGLAGDRRPYAFGRGALWRARIEAALGQDKEAISLLRTGLAQGLNFDQAYINMMPDFRGLEKYAEYRELFRPKG
jgi:tetratricopeptide (TPR) repeat protein